MIAHEQPYGRAPDCGCMRTPCRHWPAPVEQTDRAARRVAWVLWAFALIVVVGVGLAIYGCCS